MAVKVKIMRFAQKNIVVNNFKPKGCQGFQFASLCSSAVSSSGYFEVVINVIFNREEEEILVSSLLELLRCDTCSTVLL